MTIEEMQYQLKSLERWLVLHEVTAETLEADLRDERTLIHTYRERIARLKDTIARGEKS